VSPLAQRLPRDFGNHLPAVVRVKGGRADKIIALGPPCRPPAEGGSGRIERAFLCAHLPCVSVFFPRPMWSPPYFDTPPWVKPGCACYFDRRPQMTDARGLARPVLARPEARIALVGSAIQRSPDGRPLPYVECGTAPRVDVAVPLGSGGPNTGLPSLLWLLRPRSRKNIKNSDYSVRSFSSLLNRSQIARRGSPLRTVELHGWFSTAPGRTARVSPWCPFTRKSFQTLPRWPIQSMGGFRRAPADSLFQRKKRQKGHDPSRPTQPRSANPGGGTPGGRITPRQIAHA